VLEPPAAPALIPASAWEASAQEATAEALSQPAPERFAALTLARFPWLAPLLERQPMTVRGGGLGRPG